MKVKNIPFYGYFGGETKQLNFQIIMDNTLYNRFKDTASSTLWSESGLNDTNTAKEHVNSFFNDHVLSATLSLFMCKKSTDHDIPRKVYDILDALDLTTTVISPSNDSAITSKIVFLNGHTPSVNYTLGEMGYTTATPHTLTWCHYNNASIHTLDIAIANDSITLEFFVFPEDVFVNGVWTPPDIWVKLRIIFHYTYNITTGLSKIQDFTIYLTHSSAVDNYRGYLQGFNLAGSGATDSNTNDPYPDDPTGPDGDLTDPELTDPSDFPELPDIDAADLGFITIYNPTKAQMQSLSQFMWSGAFDLATYKKLFSDPMQSIIGLGVVPVVPTLAGSKNVMFGSIDSGVSMSYCSTQWVKKNCGTAKVKLRSPGSFLDYSPYVKVSIYLPFIGIRQLSAEDVMNSTLEVEYNIDVLSGACSAFINCGSKGVLYTFNGSCISNIPLTAINFSSAIQNAITAVASGVGVIAGMATGTAPLTAASASALASSAANAAINSKPSVQRSGNIGGSAGIMSILRPFLIIERPNYSVASNIQGYVGEACNYTTSLGSCSGFTMVEYCHIDNVTATPGELSEIEALLKQGVIL